MHLAITLSVRFDVWSRALRLLAAALSCASCQRTAPAPRPPLFELVAPQASGVTFVNELPEDTAFNILSYLYYYNGGGVAAGDINNDGLPDGNRAYSNTLDGPFQEMAAPMGLGGGGGESRDAAFGDPDCDGHTDLVV